jgi:AcrR family transcriptional regulator
MPTQTFFHLPDEKQRRLLEAARTEFSRVPLKEASIANIVKLADIPRGSFYQYFEDKEDLYFYYFETLRQDSSRDMLKIMREADGDLFVGFEVYFSKMIREILEGENSAFYRNLFMNMDYRSSKKVSPELSRKEKHEQSPHHAHKKHAKDLIEIINREQLNVKDEHELDLLIQVLMNIVFSTIAHAYKSSAASNGYSIDQAIQEFQLKLSWLKNGAYK